MLGTQGHLVVTTQPLACLPTRDAPAASPVLGARRPEGPALMKEGGGIFRPRNLEGSTVHVGLSCLHARRGTVGVPAGCGVTFIGRPRSRWAVGAAAPRPHRDRQFPEFQHHTQGRERGESPELPGRGRRPQDQPLRG